MPKLHSNENGSLNVERLKFAHARGARIEVQFKTRFRLKWDWTLSPAWNFEKFEYRIHPHDAHLEYGPLSTALRETLVYRDGPTDPSFQEAAFKQFNQYLDQYTPSFLGPVATHGKDVCDLAVLIFAEYLADQGL